MDISSVAERTPPALGSGIGRGPVRRSWSRRIARGAVWTVALLLVVGLGAAVDGVWTVRRSFPAYGGDLRLAGLSAPVTVHRDDHAIPQVYAATAGDLFRAQGYVTAQDRFWEMDFRRHVTSGRLSELFGAGQLANDKLLRTLDWRGVAEKEWDLISPQARQYLRDYADGVNAYLARRRTAEVSLEYAVLGWQRTGYVIAPWDPIDSLAWLKAMAWDLRGNIGDEVARATLLASGLTRTQVESLYPAYPAARNAPIVSGTVRDGAFVPSAPTVAPPAAAPVPPRAAVPPPGPAPVAGTGSPSDAGGGRSDDAGPALMRATPPDLGSNSFVVSGALTTTGKPILENDPHLGPSLPGIWYQIGLHCRCGLEVTGFSLSGVPGVVIGHNARIAWGFTNLNPDVTDLYLEKVRGDQYLVDGAWRDLAVRHETIRVAGGAPVSLTIRDTDKGPLLDSVASNLRTLGAKPPIDASGAPTERVSAVDPVAGTAYGVALQWTALQPGRTMDALFAVDAAGNWDEFRAAAALFAVPAQNMTYADVDGNIGYQAPGQIPIRAKGDGRWPAPGWDSAYGWTGFVPFAELPYEFNPARGYIVTANQEVIDPATYPHLLTADWSNGYRSHRLTGLIEARVRSGAKISVPDATAFALDSYSELAEQLVPALVAQSLSGPAVRAQALLRDWDFQQPADGAPGTAAARSSAAAAYFNAVVAHLLADVFDELPKGQKPSGIDRWWLVLTELMAEPTSAWWDKASTPTVETRDDMLRAALGEAATELTGTLGGQPAGWRWGRLHALLPRSPSFGTSGIAPIEWLFNADPVGVSGGGGAVNATGWDAASRTYAVNAVPSMRMVVPLGDLDAARWVNLTGESGHAFDRHYTDQLELWRTGGTLPMRWTAPAITKAAVDTLTLHP
jgi:penicillin amidase